MLLVAPGIMGPAGPPLLQTYVGEGQDPVILDTKVLPTWLSDIITLHDTV